MKTNTPRVVAIAIPNAEQAGWERAKARAETMKAPATGRKTFHTSGESRRRALKKEYAK